MWIKALILNLNPLKKLNESFHFLIIFLRREWDHTTEDISSLKWSISNNHFGLGCYFPAKLYSKFRLRFFEKVRFAVSWEMANCFYRCQSCILEKCWFGDCCLKEFWLWLLWYVSIKPQKSSWKSVEAALLRSKIRGCLREIKVTQLKRIEKIEWIWFFL